MIYINGNQHTKNDMTLSMMMMMTMMRILEAKVYLFFILQSPKKIHTDNISFLFEDKKQIKNFANQ